MRILTQFARPGLKLARPVVTVDDLPVLGRGTELTRRHLRTLYEAGVKVIVVEDDPELSRWDCVPEVGAFLTALDARFEPTEGDRRMSTFKGVIREVYVDFLLGLDEMADRD